MRSQDTKAHIQKLIYVLAMNNLKLKYFKIPFTIAPI